MAQKGTIAEWSINAAQALSKFVQGNHIYMTVQMISEVPLSSYKQFCNIEKQVHNIYAGNSANYCSIFYILSWIGGALLYVGPDLVRRNQLN